MQQAVAQCLLLGVRLPFGGKFVIHARDPKLAVLPASRFSNG